MEIASFGPKSIMHIIHLVLSLWLEARMSSQKNKSLDKVSRKMCISNIITFAPKTK